MRILFDQGTPVALRNILEGHTVRTAREQGWSTLLNGDLLHAAEKEKFDLLLTTDTSIPYRQNLQGRKLAIVILNRNKWSLVRSRAQQIADAIEAAKPGTCTLVEIPAK